MQNLSRLRELAEVVLPKVEEENFSLSKWKCGSVACAVGHACQYQPFVEQGLSLTINEDLFDDVEIPLYRGIHGRGIHGITAVSSFFNISHEDSEYLFLEDEYPYKNETKKGEVIERILDFCNKKEA